MRTFFIVSESRSKLTQVSVGMCTRHGLHALHFSVICVLCGELSGEKGRHVLWLTRHEWNPVKVLETYQIHHDFTEEHVFQCC
jgi:hypothetical protein